jgi:hypothetical protein
MLYNKRGMISETNGQAALSFVLVMGAIGLIIALLLSAYAISFVSGAYGNTIFP